MSQDHTTNSLPAQSLWTVLGKSETRPDYYKCRCQCGTEKEIRWDALTSGQSLSCGCYQRRFHKERLTTHNVSRTREYQIWKNIINRCYTTKDQAFKNYGGRGITVCERWRASVLNFITDMGPRPSPGHCIERIDNDGPYSPENCRWATTKEQARNKRTSHFLTYNGRTATISEWSEILGIPLYTLKTRVVQLKWDDEKAITTPVRQRGIHKKG